MRVLHILNELNLSGAETMLRSAAPHWKKRGIVGDVLSTGDCIGPYGPLLEQAGYRVLHLPFSRTPGFLWRVYGLISMSRYDAVHIHTERASLWYALAARSAGCRNVLRTLHGTYQYSGQLRLRKTFERRLIRALGIKSVSVSESVYHNELQRLNNRTTVVKNWYDSERIRPATRNQRLAARARFDLPEGAFVVASVGNCSPVKNHTAVLEALGKVTGDGQFIYMHAGREEQGMPERQLAIAHGLERQTRFLGPVDDIAAVLHAADAFVMPSLVEGLGVAAIEALGAGVPSILARVPGLEALSHLGKGIWWVNPKDIKAIAHALTDMSVLPELERAKLSAELSKQVEERYGLSHGPERYARLYLRKHDESSVGLA